MLQCDLAGAAQATFVDQLYKTGMVDEAEHQMLEEVVDKHLRRFSRKGPAWTLPRGTEAHPFLPLTMHDCHTTWACGRTCNGRCWV